MKGILKRCYKDSYLQSYLMTSAYPSIFKKVEPLIDRFLVLTLFQKELLKNLGIADNKLLVKPHFIPEEKTPKFRESKEPYVVFVGILEDNKGILTLLRAFEEINDIGLKIIGDGPLYRNIIDQCANRPNIHVLGRQDNAIVLEEIAGAKFLIMPSELYETFGLTIIESYACGTPVIASDLGTRKELVVNGVTGYLFEPGNAVALRNLIIEKSKNYPYNMPADCLKYFEERFSETQNTKYIEEIYKSVIENNTNGNNRY
jgi:glycosyltransferase involved in cell wall biosynthesis